MVTNPRQSWSSTFRLSSGVLYDAPGNMTNDGLGHTYFYDGENRLVQVDGTFGNCSSATACYTYDAEGRRAAKTLGASTVDYLYDLSGKQVVEVSSAGVWNRGEVYAGSRHLATYTRGATGATYFSTGDWLGTERMRTGVSGPIVETCTSLPFGDGQTCTGNETSPMHFTGQQLDSETNLAHMDFRSLSTTQGRWTSMDPAGKAAANANNPQTWNRYAYVLNNPTMLTDPTGLLWQRNMNGGWDWSSWCPIGATCATELAQQQGTNVVVYGPSSASDKQSFASNSYGYVNVANIAATDGAYFKFQSGVTATYASPQTAADLYNAAFDYHLEYPHDADLSLNDIGNANGSNFDPHTTHNLGRSGDMSYIGPDGNPIHEGKKSVFLADDDRMKAIAGIFKENGFNQNYSDNNVAYGINWADHHDTHFHFGKSLGLANCEIGAGACQ